MEKFHMADILPLIGIPFPTNGKSSFYVQCPCCDDSPRHKNLNINLKKDVFRCPKCGVDGGIFDMYALYTGVPRDKVRKAIVQKLGPPETFQQQKRKPLNKPENIEQPLADLDIRHATYSALLSKLSLASDHRNNLHKRGLPDEDIERLGYKTMPIMGMSAIARQLQAEGFQLAGVPGFYRDKFDNWTLVNERRGILIPVRDKNGKIMGITNRRDNAVKRKFRWIASTDRKDGCKSGGWVHIAGKIRPVMVLTEGPMKADIIHALSGHSVIAVPGVNSLLHLEKTLMCLKEDGLSEIMTAFDMDFMINWHVQDGYDSLTELITGMGMRYGIYVWDPRYKGLDDYIKHKIFGDDETEYHRQ